MNQIKSVIHHLIQHFCTRFFHYRLEASVISDSQPAAPPQLELLSSKSDELAADQSPNGLEERRLTTVKYVTPTSYKFVATTITATKTLAAAGGLSCLPAGYALC